MPLFRSILNHVQVLHVSFTEATCRYTLTEVCLRQGKVRIRHRIPNFDLGHWKGKKQKHPVVLVLSGKGIVSKEYAQESEAIRRITDHPEVFLFASESLPDNRIRLTFLRREQYEEQMDVLSAYKLPIVDTRIDPQGDTYGESLSAGSDFFNKTLNRKNLFQPSEESNILFSLVTRRLLLPVSGLLLLLLLVNFFFRQHLDKQIEERLFKLHAIRQSETVRDKEQGQLNRMYEMLLPEAGYPYAWIADRIAGIIPDGILLTELSIHPLMKKLQEQKPLETEPKRIILRGESSESTPVTLLSDALQGLEEVASVQLLSLTRNRNDRYVFEIDLRL